ncbi:unnamed protein product [Adineta ricciae]|uniref:Uncharacterized protein n=1 Tax=Adineta ricciae TaxID=249248 RepID=A0A814DC55_ADIRI|nr:unnamed protein product [Adineta ricciae]
MYRLEQGESYLPDKQTALEDRYYNNPSFQEEYPVNDPDVQNAATKIQAQFRGHKARQDLDKKRREKDLFDTDRQELGYDRGQSTTPRHDDDHHQTSARVPSAKLHHEEKHEHKPKKEEEDQPFSEELTEEEKAEQERAARSIQARFRGHKNRKSPAQDRSSPGSAVSDRDQPSDRPHHHESDNEKVSSRPSSRLDGKHDSDRHETGKYLSDQIHIKKTQEIISNSSEHHVTSSHHLEREPTQLSEDFERHTQIPRDFDFDRENRPNLDADESDMNDPNLDKAATRIQASFRGYKTRKELGTGGAPHDQHPSSTSSHPHDEYDHAHHILSSSVEGNKEPEFHEEDDNVAATKIQAAYRGYRVRKDMEK